MTESTNETITPPNHIHLIVSGETLSKIAARHDLRVEDLLAANKDIKDPNRIMVGQRLRIPIPPAHAPVMPEPINAAPAAEPTVSIGMPNTSGKSEKDNYNLYASYFARFGVKLNEMEADRRTILGLRVTSSTKVRDGQGEYNDRLVVAWQSAHGTMHAREFEANTEPSSRYEDTPEHRRTKPKKILGEDANKDGRLDLGCLPDGLYFFEKSTSGQFGKVLRPVHDIFVLRDIDHDGDFDSADKVASIAAHLNSEKSVLFHAGGNSITGSAGCQTMQPAIFKSFWEALGNQNRFQYVVATVK